MDRQSRSGRDRHGVARHGSEWQSWNGRDGIGPEWQDLAVVASRVLEGPVEYGHGRRG